METAKGNRKNSTGNSLYNQYEFFVENLIKAGVNTAIPVKVVGVETTGAGQTGFVDVMPLVESYDGFGNAISSQTIFSVPYFRVQGGVASLIVDPIIGDIGVAVFAQQDITNVSDNPKKPDTKRAFSMADAMYFGGIRNQAPSVYIEITQGNVVNIIAPSEVYVKSALCTIDCDSFTVNATNNVQFNTPTMTASGTFTAQTIQTSAGVNLGTHTHNGVTSGNSNTGSPN